jgi:hypothetical protein
LAAALVFVISFTVFVPSLKNDFVWDDVRAIRENYNAFRNFNFTHLLIPKDTKRKRVGYYRPVVFSSMFMDRTIWGESPLGFHLSNLIFHSVSAVLFYLLAVLLLGEFKVERKEGIAFLSALFFAFHPMHVESVAWIAGRTDVLCGLFFFLAFIFYMLSYRKLWWLSLSAIPFFLALLSKEVAIAFPIVALGFDLITGRHKSRGNILKYAICGVLVLAYLYVRGRGFIIIPELTGERLEQAAIRGSEVLGVLTVMLNSYLFYMKELVLPFTFNAFIGTVPGVNYYLVSSILILLLLCVVGLVSVRKKEGITAFCLVWIMVTIAPSAVIAVSRFAATPLAERYLYIPSAGFCLLLGYLILRLGTTMKAQKIAWGIGFLFVISYLFFTVDRQSVWRNNLALWGDTTTKSSNQFLPHLNYGAALERAHRYDEAIVEYLRALDGESWRTNRQRARVYSNIGIVHGLKGNFASAEEWFDKAIRYDPRYGRPYYHLGVIYLIRGDRGDFSSYIRSEEYLKKTLKIYPNYGRAYVILAKLYVRLGERDKARENAKKALRSRLNQSLAEDAEYILKILN